MDHNGISVGLIGAGEWGRNYARVLPQTRGATLRVVCDQDHTRLAGMTTQHPALACTLDCEEVFSDSRITAVVIATSASTHAHLAARALSAGKHVLVEKPMALHVGEAEALAREAERLDRCLMVGHLLLYHPAVERLKALIASGDLGEIRYAYSQRLNLGRVRKDENALWCFGPHDVSMVLDLFAAMPETVTATGAAYLQPQMVDVVFMTMAFPDGRLAHIHLSWLDPHKTRKLTLVGSRKMAVFDDMEPAEKIRIFDKGVDAAPRSVSYEESLQVRFGDVVSPYVPVVEPLRLQCEHFLESVRRRSLPRTDASHGLRVVRVLAAAQQSLESGGVPVEVKGTEVRGTRSEVRG